MDMHRLRRLRWQARAASPAEAFALRSLLREQGNACQAALERGFDSAAPRHEVWHLPRLELRVQAADLQSLGAAGLAERVETALRAALAQAQAGAAESGGAPTEGAGGPAVATRPVPASAAASHRPAPAEGRRALRHYLSTGLLPWTLAGLAPEQAQRILCAAAMQAAESVLDDAGSLDALLPRTGVDARIGALLRWLPLLPAALRLRWLAAHRARPALEAGAVDAWRAWIDDTAADRLEWQALWLAGPLDATALRQRVASQRNAAGGGPPFLGALWKALKVTAEPSTLAASGLLPPSGATDATTSAREAPSAAALRPAVLPTQALRAAAGAPLAEGSTADESLLVPLAGLVLLHPWLPRLLKACGVLGEDSRKIAPALLPRACALLHALACGETEAAEHQLPLVKLLLGRPPGEPLIAALPALAPADGEEIGALLAAVREHWSALRRTGIDGLRMGFLQRRGLLAHGDGVWRLRMQQESFDLLLGLLPWAIGQVRLPWMREPLLVEWPTP